MYNKICEAVKLPALYEKTKVPFWDDAHISAQMLKAHLDPDFEGASRKKDFIDRSAAWIGEIAPPQEYKSLLDVGCGPGLYAERFEEMGYQVTGVDFSRRSIDYAIASAAKQGKAITYHYQDYLKMNLEKKFDLATMIYCDYGALSDDDRRTLLANVRRHLRPGGKFLFDVFSVARLENFKESRTWEINENGGFWRETGYVALNRQCRYKDRVTLEQITVIDGGEPVNYYLWNTHFTAGLLAREAEAAGFHVLAVYGDIKGTPCSSETDTLAILLEA